MVDRILNAGRDVLVNEGYDAFSTNRVAVTAQVSPGSVYQYFADKATILDMVIDRYWAVVADQVAASLTDRVTITGPAIVRSIADALIEALESDAALLRVVTQELPLQRNAVRLRSLERQVGGLIGALLTVRQDSTRRSSAAVSAWVIMLSVQHLGVRWVIDQPTDVSREQMLDEIEALVLGYLSRS